MTKKARLSKSMVLGEVLLSGTTSRRHLCKKLKISKAAMTQMVNKLLKTDLLEEGSTITTSQRGRKSVLLRARPDFAYLLGTDLEGLAIRACVIDCEKRIVASAKRAIAPNWSLQRILQQWNRVVEETIAASGIAREKIAGLGIGLPGQVSSGGDLKSRTYLPPGRWTEVDATKIFNKFMLPSVCRNNVLCVAQYEKTLGVTADTESFITVLIRYGVGVAIHTKGSFLAGDGFFTGELGHSRIDLEGPRCLCGQTGCLDGFVSGRSWSAVQIDSDRTLKRELSKRGRYLAMALGNLLKIFYSPVIVIDGIYNEYAYELQSILQVELAREIEGLRLPMPEILFGDSLEFKASIGAALLAGNEFVERYCAAHLGEI